MTWLRVDDGMVDHPKIETLSDAAFRVHMRALSYCARWSTDGDVPAQKVAGWGKPKVIAECVTAGVWHAEGAIYVIHDFLDYNPSKADLDKKAAAGKKGADIRYGKADAIAGATDSAIAGASPSAMAPARDPVPSRPSPDPSPAQPSPRAAAAGAVYRAAENLLGILNKPVADKIGEAIDAYSEEWILAAIEESALANARSWKYVAAILERWGRDGFQVDKRPKGAPNGRGADVGTASLVKDFDWEAADKRREDAERRVAAARAAAVDQVPSARHGAG